MNKLFAFVLFIFLFAAGIYLGYVPRTENLAVPAVENLTSTNLASEKSSSNGNQLNSSATRLQSTTTENSKPQLAEAQSAANKNSSSLSATESHSTASDETVTTFTNESRSEDWAQKRENKLRERFALDPDLLAKELKKIECRSTLCKVEIRAENKSDALPLGSSVNKMILMDQDHLFSPKIFAKYSEQDKTLSFYFGN